MTVTKSQVAAVGLALASTLALALPAQAFVRSYTVEGLPSRVLGPDLHLHHGGLGRRARDAAHRYRKHHPDFDQELDGSHRGQQLPAAEISVGQRQARDRRHRPPGS